jgi:hypothetical protein
MVQSGLLTAASFSSTASATVIRGLCDGADGANQTRLTRNNATESPDGNSIAFVTIIQGKEQVFVMNPDGSKLKR